VYFRFSLHFVISDVDFSPQLYVCLDYPLGYINFGLWVVRFMNLSPNYESNAVGISICVALVNQNKLETKSFPFQVASVHTTTLSKGII